MGREDKFPSELESESNIGTWGTHCREKDGWAGRGLGHREGSWLHFHKDWTREPFRGALQEDRACPVVFLRSSAFGVMDRNPLSLSGVSRRHIC